MASSPPVQLGVIMPEKNLVAVGHEKTPDGFELSIRGLVDRRLQAINPTNERTVST